MITINVGNELKWVKGDVVIYGGGRWGRLLYAQACEYFPVNKLFICDSDKKVYTRYPHFIAKENLKDFLESNQNTVIVICVKNDCIAQQICEELYNNLCLEKNRVWRFIPESYETARARVRREGCFNGQKIVPMQSNEKANYLIENMITQKIPFLLSRWGGGWKVVLYSIIDLDCSLMWI